MDIKNKQLRAQLEAKGLGNIILEKGNGYLYLRSEDDKTESILQLGLHTRSIAVCHFSHLSVDAWVQEIEQMWNVALLEYTENYGD